jgi:serine protease Do
VIGILVPLSPDENSVLAGAQWYDSGVGFAVPIADVFNKLEQLKQGQELRSGLLGVVLKGNDIYSNRAEIALCRAQSPASVAGLQAGDIIVTFNGRPIARQADFKHAIGPLYEGDQVEVIVMRDGESHVFSVNLAGEISPYRPGAIGILPSVAEGRLSVRYVFDGSPAQQAGLLIGDQILNVDSKRASNWDAVRQVFASASIGDKVKLELQRASTRLLCEVVIGDQTANVPTGLESNTVEGHRPDSINQQTIKVPELPNHGFAIIPRQSEHKLHPTAPAGLLVWLPETNTVKPEEVALTWKAHCLQRNVVMLVLTPADSGGWRSDETEFVTKSIQQVRNAHQINLEKIAVGGEKAGGTMAAICALNHRELFRGLILIDPLVPGGLPTAETAPDQPLLIFAGNSSEYLQKAKLDSALEAFNQAHFPVNLESIAIPLSDTCAEHLMKWVDALDRL